MSPALRAVAALFAIGLSGCSGAIVPPGTGGGAAPPPAGPPRVQTEPLPEEPAIRPTPATPLPASPAPDVAGAATARALGVVAGPAFDRLGVGAEGATRALQAFRISCPSLVRRTDASGLTQGADWKPACDAAAGWRDADALRFFSSQFDVAQVGTGTAFATGYFEPEIAASRTRRAGYDVPVYRRPPDLVEADLGLFSDQLKGRKIRGRVDGAQFVPYHDRAAIETGALQGRGLELAWAADPVEFFFLQIQGSGRLRLPDGSVMRIGYDSQNGRDYTGIGALMRDRGLLQPGQASMQGIMAWLRANPEQGRSLMRENKSWVFFRELTGPGPLGALGLPVTGRATVAADPAFVPLGAPVFLSLDRADATGLWVAQDTGGAIKGANRFDTFWGAGAQARATAGGMSGRGTAFLLLPKGSVARLNGAAGGRSPPRR